ncbi:MAG: alpha/beta fold hydrolase [Holosporales bacterium]|jgi:polyhydroxyalkanoate synthase|nr:alpha/beta fold hydrolase [Holosporales bacterium]
MTSPSFDAENVSFFFHWLQLMGLDGMWSEEQRRRFLSAPPEMQKFFTATHNTSKPFSSFLAEKREAFSQGITAYQRFSRAQDASPPLQEIWRQGPSALQYFPAETPVSHAAVLFLPALMNKPGIFHFPHGGFCSFLARHGIASYLLDWGAFCGVSFDAYGTEILFPALREIRCHFSGSLFLFGYCMGAIAALGLAQHDKKESGLSATASPLAGIVLLSPPWDLRTYPLATQQSIDAAFCLYENDLIPEVTEPLLIRLFLNMLQPWAIFEKYARFAHCSDPEAQKHFVQVEDWLNNLYPLSTSLIRTTVRSWFLENTLATGQWRLLGEVLVPERLEVPTLVVMPLQDRVIPPASGQVLSQRLRSGKVLYPPVGHIGALVSHQAETLFWKSCLSFLKNVISNQETTCGTC